MGSIITKPLDNAWDHSLINALGHPVVNHWLMHELFNNKPLDNA